jgi:hypothetical protein
MEESSRKKYCLIDHANKQKELARFTPYEFWSNQVKRQEYRRPEEVKSAKAAGR